MAKLYERKREAFFSNGAIVEVTGTRREFKKAVTNFLQLHDCGLRVWFKYCEAYREATKQSFCDGSAAMFNLTTMDGTPLF